MFYDGNNSVNPGNSIQFIEHEICYPKFILVSAYCPGEDQTPTMTTATVQPKPAPRKINDKFSCVQQTSQYFVQSQISSSYARQKPTLSRLDPNNCSQPLMKTNICDNPVHSAEIKQQRLNGQTQSPRDEIPGGGSSTDDTEDSTDKSSKPKPGKLDLRQFDNITNAIGKLNVQSKKTLESTSRTQSKSQIKHDSPQEVIPEFSYFKNRSKKSKSKVKESPLKGKFLAIMSDDGISVEKVSPNCVDDFMLVPDEEHSQEKSVTKTKKSAKQSVIESVKQRENVSSFNTENPKSSMKRDNNPSAISISARTSRFPGGPERPLGASAFDSSPKEGTGNQNLPMPAPRSAQPSSSVAAKVPTVGTTTSSATTKTTPSLSSNPSAAGKRITNPRQNHGRAVAPPQLPGSHLPSGSSIDATKIVADRSIHQISTEEHRTDFSQSPIAQRVLNYSKDYKGRYIPNHFLSLHPSVRIVSHSPSLHFFETLVSELNSPYESDNEQGPTPSSLRNPRLQRGISIEISSIAIFISILLTTNPIVLSS